MSRLVLALLAGMVFLAGAASAGQSESEPGRYEVIPDAAVPDKAGKVNQKAILLDTATGRTWVLSASGEFGGLPGPLWEPLKMKPIEPVQASASGTNKASKAKAPSAKKPAAPRKPARASHGAFDRYDYDDNP